MRFGGMSAGDTVFDVVSKKVGEELKMTVRLITIISCDRVKKTVVGRINGGNPSLFREIDYKNWRANEPEIINDPIGGVRVVKKTSVTEQCAA